MKQKHTTTHADMARKWVKRNPAVVEVVVADDVPEQMDKDARNPVSMGRPGCTIDDTP